MDTLSFVIAMKKVITGDTSTNILQVLRDATSNHIIMVDNNLLQIAFIKAMKRFLENIIATHERITLKDVSQFYYVSLFILDLTTSNILTKKFILINECFPLVLEYIKKKELSFARKLSQEVSEKMLTFFCYLRKVVLTYEGTLPGLISFGACCIEVALFWEKNPDIQKEATLMAATIYFKYPGDVTIINQINYLVKDTDRDLSKRYAILSGSRKSSLAVCLVIFIQKGLSAPCEPMAAYKSSFWFAAHIVDSLIKACQTSTGNVNDEVEKLIADVIYISNDVRWSSARLLLNLFAKSMTESMLKSNPPKFKVFALKQIVKLAIQLRTHERIYKKALSSLRETYSIETTLDELPNCVRRHLENLPADPINSDPLRALNALMSNGTNEFVGKSSNYTQLSYSFSHNEVNSIAYMLEVQRASNGKFDNYINVVLNATWNVNRSVKSATAKGLETLITFEPDLLQMANVEKAMELCLTYATSSGKCAIASALEKALISNPHIIQKYVWHFKKLLIDDLPSVRKAAIIAIESVCLADRTESCNQLISFAIALANDIDDSVQKRVASFFKSIFIDKTDFMLLLFQLCTMPQILAAVSKILMTLTTLQNLIPATNVPTKVLSESDSLHNLSKNISCYFTNALAVEQKESAISILKIIAEKCPDAIKNHVSLLRQILFHVSFGESVKRSAAETLSNVHNILDEQFILEMKKCLCVELESEKSLTYSITYRTALLKLLLITCHNDRNFITQIVQNAKNYLKFALLQPESVSRQLVKKSLCAVIFLWKEYQTDLETNQIIHHFLTNKSYNLTVLSVICQARLEYVPTISDLHVEDEIGKFIRHRADDELTKTALYYIDCLLRGYQKIEQAPDMKVLGDSTTESVSSFLQKYLPDILKCALDPCADVRKYTYPVINLIMQSGLIIITRLVPCILALTTDPQSFLKEQAFSLLRYASEQLDISPYIIQGLRLAYNFSKELPEATSPIRGFNPANKLATFGNVYKAIRMFPPRRRKFIDTIFHEIMTCKDWPFIIYLTDQLVTFTYKYVHEVVHVVTASQNVSEHYTLTSDQFNPDIHLALYAMKCLGSNLSQYYNLAAEADIHKDKCIKYNKKRLRKHDVFEEILKFYENEGAVRNFLKECDVDDDDSEDDNIPLNVLKMKLMAGTHE